MARIFNSGRLYMSHHIYKRRHFLKYLMGEYYRYVYFIGIYGLKGTIIKQQHIGLSLCAVFKSEYIFPIFARKISTCAVGTLIMNLYWSDFIFLFVHGFVLSQILCIY